MSIWRLLPRCPVAELPVRFTPGILRTISEMSLETGVRSRSVWLIFETPSDCLTCASAVTTILSSVTEGISSSLWASAGALMRAIKQMVRFFGLKAGIFTPISITSRNNCITSENYISINAKIIYVNNNSYFYDNNFHIY